MVILEDFLKVVSPKVNVNIYSYSEPLTSGTALEILDNVFSRQYLQYTVMRVNSRHENSIDVIVTL